MRLVLGSLVCALTLTAGAGSTSTKLAPLPKGLPSSLQIGLADQPGGAAALRKCAPFRFRYQYLAGGANTGDGWATWNENGTFAMRYVQESLRHGFVPFFSYYMLRQSLPGRAEGDEARADLENLANEATRNALLGDLELFFRRAGAFRPKRVVLQVEPDLWGYVQQRAKRDDAATVPQAREFARAVVDLRDRLAPNVLLAYPMSIWGTNIDIAISDPSLREVSALAARAARFYRSLGVGFDLATAEFSDRDSEFKRRVQGAAGWAWWNAADFRRHVAFLARFSTDSALRIVLWQIPFGNTRMRAMDNTHGHYQDNRVEWLLDEPARTHLSAYRSAGVIAFLFGGGAEGNDVRLRCQEGRRHEPRRGEREHAPVAQHRRRRRVFQRARARVLPPRRAAPSAIGHVP